MNTLPQTIQVNVSIYGELVKQFDRRHIAILDIELPPGTHLGGLLEQLKIKPEDTSYIFVNAVLCDVPGITISHTDALNDSAHVGIFSQGYMWPYQYRNGTIMSDALTEAMEKFGAMHHTYTGIEDQ